MAGRGRRRWRMAVRLPLGAADLAVAARRVGDDITAAGGIHGSHRPQRHHVERGAATLHGVRRLRSFTYARFT